MHKTAPMPPTPTRVVLDCDPGIDDAFAILYLASRPDVTIEAVGTVHGNVAPATSARNALRILDVAGLPDVPVAVGAVRPMAQEPHTAEFVHGDDGLGNTSQPPPRRAVSGETAVEQLLRLARAHPGELSVLATAPLTNLGAALLVEPELPRLVRQVVVMGGAFAVAGNVSGRAEANIANDPEAAQLVLSAGWPLRIVGLDVTHEVLLGAPELARLAAGTGEAARFASSIVQFYVDFYESRTGVRACPIHDALAAALLVEPGLATWDPCVVDVELRGDLTRGATFVDRRPDADVPAGRSPVDVAVAVDAGRAVAGLLAALGV
jgi:purine nucleosidase